MIRFLSANKNDANVDFASMSTSSNTTQLVGSGTAKLIAIGSAGLNDGEKQIGYRSESRLDIVFKFDGTASLDIYVNANGSSNRSFELRSFSSTKALSAITASDYSSATIVTSNVSVAGAAFSSASSSTTEGGGSVSSGVITMSSSGGIKISYSSLAAGYYVFKSTGNSSSYIYGFDATMSGSGDPVAVTGITIAPSPASVKVGKTVTLTPTIAPANATDKTVTWSVKSGNTYVSVVPATGVVTGLAEGTAVITATANDGSGVSQNVTVNVEAFSCPTSGELFSITMGNITSKKSIEANEYVDVADYGTVNGGTATYGASQASKAEIGTGNPGSMKLGGAAACLQLNLDCAMQAGDVLSFTSSNTVEIALTTTPTRSTTIQTSGLSYIVPQTGGITGNTIYIWQNGSTSYIKTLTITRPAPVTKYTVTYALNGGTGTAPMQEDVAVGGTFTVAAMPSDVTPPTDKEFDKWNDGTADYAAGATYTMGTSNVTLTAKWKDACALAPAVSATTLGTTSYTTQVVNCAGISVLGSAGCTISEYGFVYGTATAPTISNNKKALGSDYTVINTAFAETTLTGLAANTKYYVRAYATNSFGTAYGEEISFTTLAAPSVADLVEISDDWTFTPSADIAAGTLAEGNKLFAAGTGDCDISSGKMRVKTNRPLAFKVAANAKVKVTFTENGSRAMQLGNALTSEGYAEYGTLTTSPAVFTVEEGGVVYLTAATDQLYFSKLEIMYPHSVTYDLNGGTGTTPTQAAKYAGETFTAHDGTTGITAPTGKEFSKWVDQDEENVLGGATYTMPAKAVTLTAQWVTPPTRYTVSFDLQGHGGSAITSQSVAEGETAVKPSDDPSESGWEFEGWYTDAACTEGNEFDFNTAITEAKELFAKWTEFDACAVLTPATSGETIGVGDAISLQTGSVGGTMEAVVKSGETTSLAYTGNGLAFNESGNTARVKVTLSHKLQKGSIIRVTLKANGGNTSDRGLDIYNEAGTKKGFLGFAKNGYTNGDVAKFSYVVTDDDGLKDTKVFYLYRNNSVWMADLKVANCAPQDYVVTYKDGETTLGTEQVFENAHPTASGIATRKNGYVFDGWAETADGAVVDLDDITITAAKTLYAQYSARVCPTSGTIFSLNMNKTVSTAVDVKNGSIDMTDYATISGGAATLANTSGNTRAKVTTTPSIQFSNGGDGYMQIDLDCPIAEGDIIRYVNSSSGTIAVRTAHGTGTGETVLDGNKTEITTVEVNAALDGLYRIFVERKGNTSDLKYFEIYRRPVLTGVSLADMTMRVGKTKTPVMTLAPSDDAIVTGQAWTIESSSPAGIATINEATGEISATAEGTITVKVVLNGDATISDECTVTIVENIAQQDVTGSIVWNWKNAGSTAIQLTNSTDPKKNEGFVMANVDVNNDPNFESDKLYVEGEHILRDPDKANPYFQGQTIKFNSTVAGIIRVTFSNTGNNNARELYINGVGTGISSASGAQISTELIDVPAGEVSITAFYVDPADGAVPQYVRVYEIEFFAVGHEREVIVGDLGTVCLPNACIARGVAVYDYQGANETGKIVFDELAADEVMEAGKPYLFQVKETNARFFYTIEEAVGTPDNSMALKGNLGEAITFQPGSAEAEHVYFVKEHAFWMAKNTGVRIGQYRCYLQMDEVEPVSSPSPAPGRRRIVMGVQGEQVATGMESIQPSEISIQKVLINGQLLILRGEKMYDATGRLVK